MKAAIKIGAAGKLKLPVTHVVKLSSMGRLHNAALDEKDDSSRGDKLSGSARKSPRRHIVRGHTFVRDDSVFWRNPHIRGGGEHPPTLVRNDVPDQTPRLDFDAPDMDM